MELLCHQELGHKCTHNNGNWTSPSSISSDTNTYVQGLYLNKEHRPECSGTIFHRVDPDRQEKLHTGEEFWECASCAKKFVNRVHYTCNARSWNLEQWQEFTIPKSDNPDYLSMFQNTALKSFLNNTGKYSKFSDVTSADVSGKSPYQSYKLGISSEEYATTSSLIGFREQSSCEREAEDFSNTMLLRNIHDKVLENFRQGRHLGNAAVENSQEDTINGSNDQKIAHLFLSRRDAEK